MKFNVTIQTALPIQSGTSKSGKAYPRQSYVGVYDSSNAQYPKSIVFDVLGDNINKFNMQPGGQYEVEVDFTAKEWKGRWFLSATCWKATPLQQQTYAQPPMPQGYQQPYGSSGYPPQQYFGQTQGYPVNPQSATPTLDSLGVQGYQPMPQSAPATNGDDDSGLPF